jgi:hypothetical protein
VGSDDSASLGLLEPALSTGIASAVDSSGVFFVLETREDASRWRVMLFSPTSTEEEISGTGGFETASSETASFLFRFLLRLPLEDST